MANKDDITRYSDEDLAEFRALIEKKIKLTEEQLESLQGQIIEISENTSDEHGGDWVDDSSINNDMEMLNNMAIRQRKYLQDLNNALLRINNKVYGICVITGKLIDKRRLLAVPTTTKSLTAKTDLRRKEEERMTHRITDNPYVKEKKKERDSDKKVISKVRKKGGKASGKQAAEIDDFDENLNIQEVDPKEIGEKVTDDDLD